MRLGSRHGKERVMIKIANNRARICIDPGHGGDDPGAVGLSGLQEATCNLKFAKELMYALELLGIDSALTRTENRALQLSQRTEAAKDCHALISIHCNAAENRSAEGIETVYSVKAGLHKALANNVHQSLMKAFPKHRNRGLKCSPSMEYGRTLYVLANSPVPACLVELEFISHPEQEKFLGAEATAGQAANALAEGLKSFLLSLPEATVAAEAPPQSKPPEVVPLTLNPDTKRVEAPMCKPEVQQTLDNQIKSSTVKQSTLKKETK